MTTAKKQKTIKEISKDNNITHIQARKSLFTHDTAISQAEEFILKNWGSLSNKMDIINLLKKFNLFGYIGAPIKLSDISELEMYMDNIEDHVLEDNGW